MCIRICLKRFLLSAGAGISTDIGAARDPRDASLRRKVSNLRVIVHTPKGDEREKCSQHLLLNSVGESGHRLDALIMSR